MFDRVWCTVEENLWDRVGGGARRVLWGLRFRRALSLCAAVAGRSSLPPPPTFDCFMARGRAHPGAAILWGCRASAPVVERNPEQGVFGFWMLVV